MTRLEALACAECGRPIPGSDEYVATPAGTYHPDCAPDEYRPGTDAYRARIEREYGQIRLDAPLPWRLR